MTETNKCFLCKNRIFAVLSLRWLQTFRVSSNLQTWSVLLFLLVWQMHFLYVFTFLREFFCIFLSSVYSVVFVRCVRKESTSATGVWGLVCLECPDSRSTLVGALTCFHYLVWFLICMWRICISEIQLYTLCICAFC